MKNFKDYNSLSLEIIKYDWDKDNNPHLINEQRSREVSMADDQIEIYLKEGIKTEEGFHKFMNEALDERVEYYIDVLIDFNAFEKSPAFYDPEDAGTYADKELENFTKKEIKNIEFIQYHPDFNDSYERVLKGAILNQDERLKTVDKSSSFYEDELESIDRSRVVFKSLLETHNNSLNADKVQGLMKDHSNQENFHTKQQEIGIEQMENDGIKNEERKLGADNDDMSSYTIKTTYGKDLITIQGLTGTTEAELQKEAFKRAVDTGVNLSNADFRKIDLSGETFLNGSLFGADLSRANLEGTRFIACNLTSANFSYSDCTDASFRDSTISSTQFEYTKANHANFTGNNIDGAEFTNSNLSKSKFEESVIRATSFNGCNLEGSSFHKAEMAHVSFRTAKMKDAKLTSAKLIEVDFSIVDAENLDLGKSKMEGVLMFDATTTNMSMKDAKGIETTNTRTTLFGNKEGKQKSFGRKK